MNNVTVAKPDNYTIEFLADGRVNVRSDCNRGSGKYTVSGSNLRFGSIALTRMACRRGSQDSLFNRGLSGARLFNRDGDKIFIDMEADSGTMHFSRIP